MKFSLCAAKNTALLKKSNNKKSKIFNPAGQVKKLCSAGFIRFADHICRFFSIKTTAGMVLKFGNKRRINVKKVEAFSVLIKGCVTFIINV